MRGFLLAVAGVALLTACGGARHAAVPGGMMPVARGATAFGAPVYITQMDRMTASRYFSQPGRARKLGILSEDQRDALNIGRPIPKGMDVRRLPGELARDMLPLPEGYRRVLAGNTLIILDRERNVVDAEPFFAGNNP